MKEKIFLGNCNLYTFNRHETQVLTKLGEL